MTELSVALQKYLGVMGLDWDDDLLLEEATLSMQLLTEIEPSRQIGAERYARAGRRRTATAARKGSVSPM
jgi:hypothetical protein